MTDWTWLWNLASALFGAVTGGFLTAYRIGEWRGKIAQQVATVETRIESIEARLADGDERFGELPALRVEIHEARADVSAFQAMLKDFRQDIQHQFERGRDIFVTQVACDERHHRRT